MPHRIQTDRAESLRLEIDYRSVHVVGYALRYRVPDGSWEDIGQGSSADDDPLFELPDMPWGSEIQYRFVYSEEADPFRVDLLFSQLDDGVDGSPVEVRGEDGDEGVVEDTVVCVEDIEDADDGENES